MALSDYLSNLTGFFGSNSIPIFGGVGLIALIAFIIWLSSRGNRLRYGSLGEGQAIKGVELTDLGFRMTGRALLWTLRGGIKGSIKLGKLAYKGGKKGGRLAKDFAIYSSKLIKGEERNIEGSLHQTSAAAASVELATVIGKLVNAELNEYKAKEIIELRLRFLDSQLAGISNIEVIDEEVRKFVIELGRQITSVLIKLVNHDVFELHLRKKSFAEIYGLLKVIKTAETLARRIERRAISNQQALSKYNDKEMADLEIYLGDKIKEENRKIKSAKAAYRNSGSADRATRVALYGQIQLAQQTAEKLKQNVDMLVQILQKLKSINWRMLKTLIKVRRDIKVVLGLINNALSKERKLQSAEKDIEKRFVVIKESSKDAESNLGTIQKEYPEEIIIALTRDAGSILNGISEIAKTILTIDSQKLLPLMQSLSNAMDEAYRVEESLRIANSFYAKLIDANQRFYQLVVEADLTQEVKNTFIQELEIEKMEKQIAEREESIVQAAKSLFIKTRNIIQNSMGRVQQHVEYLSNNIVLTEQTKDYTLNVLSTLMQNLSVHKTRVNEQFSQKAEEYQQRLQDARFKESITKLAA